MPIITPRGKLFLLFGFGIGSQSWSLGTLKRYLIVIGPRHQSCIS